MKYARSLVLGTSMVIGVFILALSLFFLSRGPCPSGSFSCDNNSKCVLQRNMCDRHADCRDRKDESREECASISYGSMTMLHSWLDRFLDLGVDSNSTKISMKEESRECRLESPLSQCNCIKTYLECADMFLTAIPRVEGVTRLQLPNNTIKLFKDSFEGYSIDLIDLRENAISYIPDGVFESQLNLTKLYFRNNLLTTISEKTFEGLIALEWLFMDKNLLHDVSFCPLPSLKWLQLQGNKIKTLHDFPLMATLFELFLGNNLIEEISATAFSQLPKLHFLQLSYNMIRSIDEKAFVNLKDLKDLDLSNNLLHFLPPTIFYSMAGLNQLSLGNNDIMITRTLLWNSTNLLSLKLNEIEMANIDFKIFKRLNSLKYAFFKKFHYCSFVPQISHCKPMSDGVSSSQDLVSRPSLRLAAWLIAFLTLSGNALVLWGRFTSRDENRALSLLIRNLAVADMLMGVYLLVIGIQDSRFRNEYQKHSHQWTDSWGCTTIGAIAMTSSEVSMLILAFMSVERFLLIVDPMGGHPRMTPRVARPVLLLLWGIGVTLAVLPIIHWHNTTRFYGSNSGMCFPLHLMEKYPLGWQYSAFIFLGINMIGLLVIAVVYCAMFISVWKTRRAAPSSADCEFAIRFFFIVLTNAACWAPIVCLKIANFFDIEISSDVYAWLVVFVVPLNSAVNPLLYTFTTPKYRDHLLAFKWRKSAERSSTGDTESSRTSSNKNITCAIIGGPKAVPPEPLISTIDSSYALDCKL